MRKTTVFITHDLDEAVRIGHRIAIMRDGMVIQIGTPEQIVINPADEYVADFVKFTRVGDFSDVLKLTDIASNRLPVPSFALVAYKLANQNSPTRKT